MRNRAFAAIVALCALGAAGQATTLPIGSGQYQFEMKDAEFPSLPGTSVRVTLDGRLIKIVSDSRDSTVFPYGTTIDEGIVLWHAASQQWIIGSKESDENAVEVGGCSGGPAVIDLLGKVYWRC